MPASIKIAIALFAGIAGCTAGHDDTLATGVPTTVNPTDEPVLQHGESGVVWLTREPEEDTTFKPYIWVEPESPPPPMVLDAYNCDVEYDNEMWKWAWSPDWQQWCCHNKNRGCWEKPAKSKDAAHPGVETKLKNKPKAQEEEEAKPKAEDEKKTAEEAAKAEAEAAEKAKAEEAAKVSDDAEKKAAGEAAKAQAEADRDGVEESAKAEAQARAQTEADEKAGKAQAEAAMKAAEEAAKARDAAEKKATQTTQAPVDLGCNTVCTENGISATCAGRVAWAAANKMQTQSAPCEAAHVLVMSECRGPCGTCRVEDTCSVPKQADVSEISKAFLELPAMSSRSKATSYFTMSMFTGFSLLAVFVSVATLASLWRRVDRNVASMSFQSYLHQGLGSDIFVPAATNGEE